MDAVLTGKGISVAYQQNIIIPSMDVPAQPRLLGCCSSTTISSATATTWAEAAAAQRTSAIVMNNFFM